MSDPPQPNVDTYGFEWPKDFDHKQYGEFMSKYITILSRRAKKWDKLLSSKESFRKSNKVKRYTRKGIPGSQRAAIWSMISGADKLREQNPDLYQKILRGPLKQEVIETISLDIPRTFPDNIYFKGSSDDSKRLSLYNVLLALAHQNPQIGYCQGLNFIAGIMLLVTDSEDTTFWLLQSLVETILPDYYTKQMTGLLTDIGVLEELIREKVPQVHNHMVQTGVSWSMYVSKWFICLFAEVLPVETVLRVWDCLFYEGSKILLRVAVTLVMKNQDKILAANNFVEITEVFKSLPDGANVTDCHTFMKAIFRAPGSFPRTHILKLREYCRRKVEKEQEATQLLQQQQREKQAAAKKAREEALAEEKRIKADQILLEQDEENLSEDDAQTHVNDESIPKTSVSQEEVKVVEETVNGDVQEVDNHCSKEIQDTEVSVKDGTSSKEPLLINNTEKTEPVITIETEPRPQLVNGSDLSSINGKNTSLNTVETC